MPATPEPTYFVAEYVDISDRPTLLNVLHRFQTLDEAERITDQLNRSLGHRIVNEVELVKSSPLAHYFMFDDDITDTVPLPNQR